MGRNENDPADIARAVNLPSLYAARFTLITYDLDEAPNVPVTVIVLIPAGTRTCIGTPLVATTPLIVSTSSVLR